MSQKSSASSRPSSREADEGALFLTGQNRHQASKPTDYRLQLIIDGVITRFTEVSESLVAFVAESNRGRHIWFVSNRLSLQDRIATIH
ncbi:DUF4180 domain-containing protein [Rhodococcus sp. G-MC3]|uniref:DUF4180 domain-containing protein n=1 Tax=Rhodococcus sp. G-MC3 TaxID=3046209 RepID=UPI0024BB09C9|nr:DUF4180 domain-containing protein [Rhodococcus sp. G-MC3]MDJ0395588.1 DUF4180 domain-containing protein [Rhodococcus sp. G-MC3]